MTQTEGTKQHEAFGGAREQLGAGATVEAVNQRAQQILEDMEAAKAGMSFISNRGSAKALAGHEYFRPSQIDFYVHGHVKRLLDRFQMTTCERHWDRVMDALGTRREKMLQPKGQQQ